MKEEGLYYKYALLAICFVFESGIFTSLVGKMLIRFMYSIYLANAVALFYTERYVFQDFPPGCF